ncbi:MAG: substrate-binding domain-containing protein, partial [Syntrophomonadaceae bacterium]|nr:substrate-binding domain-containing protein [Syntrophomonadaceae bacterium]
DFISFIMSGEGQAIVAQSCVPVDDGAPAFVSDLPAGRLVIAGSSSVAPVMEKLVEGYGALNPEAVIELQVTDSTAGINAVLEGIADIAMASRDLKESELERLTPTAIAIDGLAVIVHPENPLDNISSADLRAVFTGETMIWQPLLPAALPE